jgi:hypothetical protein
MRANLTTEGMQIERDSNMPASGHREVVTVTPQHQLYGAAYTVPAQNLDSPGRRQGKFQHPPNQSILPDTYMTPALPRTTTNLDQAHISQLNRSAAMWSTAPQYPVPAIHMHAQVPTAQPNNITSYVSTSSPPLPDCNREAHPSLRPQQAT